MKLHGLENNVFISVEDTNETYLFTLVSLKKVLITLGI